MNKYFCIRKDIIISKYKYQQCFECQNTVDDMGNYTTSK